MTNELKKQLYREKPEATLQECEQTEAVELFRYTAQTSTHYVEFEVLRSDMGEKVFDYQLPAQLLIRWLSFGILKQHVL